MSCPLKGGAGWYSTSGGQQYYYDEAQTNPYYYNDDWHSSQPQDITQGSSSSSGSGGTIKPGVLNRLEDEVRAVGIKKLLGYWDNIPALQYTGYTQESLIQEQEARGMKVMIAPAAIQSNNNLCIFVYDPVRLQNYLNLPDKRNILNNRGWPTDAKSFVEKVSAKVASEPDLYELIAIAFNYKNAHEGALNINSLS